MVQMRSKWGVARGLCPKSPVSRGPQPGSNGRPRGREGAGGELTQQQTVLQGGQLCPRNPRGWVQDLAHLGHLDLRAEVPGTICYFCFGDRLGEGENLPLFSSLRTDSASLLVSMWPPRWPFRLPAPNTKGPGSGGRGWRETVSSSFPK